MLLPTLLLYLLTTLPHLSTARQHNRHRTIHVSSGSSIQAAINRSHRGDTIIVSAGTYAEQITITTPFLTLIGHNAIILPPSTYITNTCTNLAGPGTQAGICISGSDVTLQPLSEFNGEHLKVLTVGRHVEGVTVTGFTVKNFPGLNIAIVGAKRAHVHDNTLSSSSQYGALTVGSEGTVVAYNSVSSVGKANGGPFGFYFIGICMDDMSDVEVVHNDVGGYFIGLCVQTSRALVVQNVVHDVCVGAFVDPGIKGARVEYNIFSNTPAGCPTTPQFSSGVTISGAKRTLVKGNRILNIRNSAGKGTGVVIMDDADTKDVAEGNLVEGNWFVGDDQDVLVTATGKGNVVRRNRCQAPSSAGGCH
ncbi:hypothetical protein TWF730_010236 [Orbilia blumenaviensis]|uniref:Right handed beta helix domain-containing protein n=1 Tax=Orbilia blumenaviensis TaxID=1796055 RepID=A0AAV9UMR7_9PEZI